jgi:uncharacterized membrane protein
MYFNLEDIIDFIKEYIGNILFFIGIILLVFGLLFARTFGSLECAIGLFFGLIFFIFGSFARLGMFSANLRSLTGLGTIIICNSVVFFSFSISIIQFVGVKVLGLVKQPSGLFMIAYRLEYPYAGLSQIFMQVSIVSFMIGIALKIFYTLR